MNARVQGSNYLIASWVHVNTHTLTHTQRVACTLAGEYCRNGWMDSRKEGRKYRG